MTLEPSVISLPELLIETVEMSDSLATKNNNTFRLEVADNLKKCWGDATRIRQIILNLLSNAAKFTDNDEILISARNSSPTKLQISVKDNGIGITDEQMGFLFQDFQQAESSTSRKYGGTGLGLSISRKLANAMDGEISLTSELNVGSCFTLHLPIYIGQNERTVSINE